MSFFSSPPPPAPAPPPKKKMGCCGCGCLILVLLVLLFAGFTAGVSYLLRSEGLALTSATPATMPIFDGGDDVHNTAMQKLTAFDHDLKNHQAATIQLTADEINTLIARDPVLTKANIHLFVTFSDSQIRLQASVPTEALSQGWFKDRYFNADVSFHVIFDPAPKTLNLDLDSLKIGDTDVPKTNLTLLQNEINPALNNLFQNDPEMKSLLDQAKAIAVQDNQLVIEIQ